MNKLSKKQSFKLAAILLFAASSSMYAQDELNLLDADSTDVNAGSTKVSNPFKTTTVINLQSPMMVEKGEWDFKINHRFGALNSGLYNAFGLDISNVRIGGEFGVAKNINIGLARTTVNKTSDLSLKAALLSQTTDWSIPVSVLYYGNVAYQNAIVKGGGITADGNVINGITSLAFVNQLIVASKLSEAITVQLSPSVVHFNLRDADVDNTLMALGIGGRAKVTNRTTINAEWIPLFGNVGSLKNSLSLGVDLETGGHIFQLHLTNSRGMNPQQFMGQTTESWKDAGIFFGFNISRVFKLYNTER